MQTSEILIFRNILILTWHEAADISGLFFMPLTFLLMAGFAENGHNKSPSDSYESDGEINMINLGAKVKCVQICVFYKHGSIP